MSCLSSRDKRKCWRARRILHSLLMKPCTTWLVSQAAADKQIKVMPSGQPAALRVFSCTGSGKNSSIFLTWMVVCNYVQLCATKRASSWTTWLKNSVSIMPSKLTKRLKTLLSLNSWSMSIADKHKHLCQIPWQQKWLIEKMFKHLPALLKIQLN